MSKTVFYASVGPALTLYDLDIDGAALTKRSAIMLPANVQYLWPHPSRRYYYVVSSTQNQRHPLEWKDYGMRTRERK